MLRKGLTIVLLLCVWNLSFGQYPDTAYANAVHQSTSALLETWYPRIIDSSHGGYITNLDHRWAALTDQPKMIVSQARGLWTAARGYEHTGDSSLLEAAAHGFAFLTEEMWDPIHGGFLQYHHDRASDQQAIKMAYGNAFALYAMAQYAKVVDDNETILNWCRRSLAWLDDAAHDTELGGYFNLITRSGQSAKKSGFDDRQIQNGWGETSWKDQNSSIHLMEAFTTLYEVMPNDTTRDRLEEMLTLVRDVMVGARGHLHLFFDRRWKPVDHSSLSREAIIAKSNHDHVSFGHDIETAYLLVDASEKLFGTCDSVTLRVAKILVDHTLQHGFDEDYAGLLDRGYYFGEGKKLEIINSNKVWWSQAEAWHALELFARLFPEERLYAYSASRMWMYIQKNMIDHEHGGWFSAGLDVNPQNKFALKAQPWKSCYHDGRSLMQVSKYLQK